MDLEKLLEEAEPVGDGLSNTVLATDDYIIKKYSKYPFTSFYTSLLEVFDFRINYVNRQERMKNEQDMIEVVRDSGVQAPAISLVQDDVIVFDRIRGKDGFLYLNECSSEDSRKLGNEMRNFLDELHRKDAAIRDCRISNFIISEQGIYSIDHEYSGMNAGLFFRFLDEATLLASVRQTSGYSNFIEGFQPSLPAAIASFFLALDHVLIFDRDIERLKNIFDSFRS